MATINATTASGAPTSATNNSAASSVVDDDTIAGNYTTFLQLLTTQLQNQDPLDPLDTNQFTEQLVQFAQVEQQLKSNDQLATLVSLQQTAQDTQALGFVGATVAIDGSTAQLAGGQAQWSFNVPKPATATINIADSTGNVAYTGSYTMQAGQQNFVWDGRGNDGTQWPDGSYKMTITAADASGQAVAISTEVDGVVDSVDLTQNPPMLSIGGQSYAISSIKRVTRSGS